MTESLEVGPERMTGYRQDELGPVTDRVSDPRDRQGPVRAELPEGERLAGERRVEWPIGTSPVLLVLPEASGRLMVRARGYRLGPSSVRRGGNA